jgi:hypothetical protein
MGFWDSLAKGINKMIDEDPRKIERRSNDIEITFYGDPPTSANFDPCGKDIAIDIKAISPSGKYFFGEAQRSDSEGVALLTKTGLSYYKRLGEPYFDAANAFVTDEGIALFISDDEKFRAFSSDGGQITGRTLYGRSDASYLQKGVFYSVVDADDDVEVLSYSILTGECWKKKFALPELEEYPLTYSINFDGNIFAIYGNEALMMEVGTNGKRIKGSTK